MTPRQRTLGSTRPATSVELPQGSRGIHRSSVGAPVDRDPVGQSAGAVASGLDRGSPREELPQCRVESLPLPDPGRLTPPPKLLLRYRPERFHARRRETRRSPGLPRRLATRGLCHSCQCWCYITPSAHACSIKYRRSQLGWLWRSRFIIMSFASRILRRSHSRGLDCRQADYCYDERKDEAQLLTDSHYDTLLTCGC